MGEIKIIILGLLLLSGGITRGQEYSLAGTWKIKEADSCTRIVYPGAEVKKYEMQHVTGTLTLSPDSLGTIESNTQILCKYHKFNWMQQGDTLTISILPGKIEGDSRHRIHFLNQRTVKIERIFGCSRLGLGIWYDVTLEKSE